MASINPVYSMVRMASDEKPLYKCLACDDPMANLFTKDEFAYHARVAHNSETWWLADATTSIDQTQYEIPEGETRTTSATGGMKGVKDQRYSLLPVEALAQVTELYNFGVKKYDAHNWRKGYEWSKSYDSMMRHANAFWGGEDIDPETGLPHLAGVVFHALTLMTFMKEQPEFDDRYSSEMNFNEAVIKREVRPGEPTLEYKTYSATTFDPPILFDPRAEDE